MPPPQRRPAGNLGEEEVEDQPSETSEVQVCTLEQNALSASISDLHSEPPDVTEPDAWTDWMQDPNMDPWKGAPTPPPPKGLGELRSSGLVDTEGA